MNKFKLNRMVKRDIKRYKSELFTLDQIIFREKLKLIIETAPGNGRVKMSPKIVPPTKN